MRNADPVLIVACEARLPQPVVARALDGQHPVMVMGYESFMGTSTSSPVTATNAAELADAIDAGATEIVVTGTISG